MYICVHLPYFSVTAQINNRLHHSNDCVSAILFTHMGHMNYAVLVCSQDELFSLQSLFFAVRGLWMKVGHEGQRKTEDRYAGPLWLSETTKFMAIRNPVCKSPL